MSATATIAGQNLGAGKPERSIEGAWVAARIGLGVPRWSASPSSRCPPPSSRLRHARAARPRDRRPASSLSHRVGFFVTVALVYNGALQGTGDTKSPFYISLVSQIVVR